MNQNQVARVSLVSDESSQFEEPQDAAAAQAKILVLTERIRTINAQLADRHVAASAKDMGRLDEWVTGLGKRKNLCESEIRFLRESFNSQLKAKRKKKGQAKKPPLSAKKSKQILPTKDSLLKILHKTPSGEKAAVLALDRARAIEGVSVDQRVELALKIAQHSGLTFDVGRLFALRSIVKASPPKTVSPVEINKVVRVCIQVGNVVEATAWIEILKRDQESIALVRAWSDVYRHTKDPTHLGFARREISGSLTDMALAHAELYAVSRDLDDKKGMLGYSATYLQEHPEVTMGDQRRYALLAKLFAEAEDFEEAQRFLSLIKDETIRLRAFDALLYSPMRNRILPLVASVTSGVSPEAPFKQARLAMQVGISAGNQDTARSFTASANKAVRCFAKCVIAGQTEDEEDRLRALRGLLQETINVLEMQDEQNVRALLQLLFAWVLGRSGEGLLGQAVAESIPEPVIRCRAYLALDAAERGSSAVPGTH